MSGYQKITVMGYMGHDPSTKKLQSGDSVTEFSIAVSDKKDVTEWFKAKAFGKNADNIDKFFSKGDMILVDGRMQTSSWDGKDGTKKYKTELIVDRWAFCGGEKKEKTAKDESGYEEQRHPKNEDPDIPF